MKQKTKAIKAAAAKKTTRKKSLAGAPVPVAARAKSTQNQKAPPFDFRSLFQSVPGLYLILQPDAPKYSILAVSDAYNAATLTTRAQIVGRGLFEVFPDNPDDVVSRGTDNLRASLGRVLSLKKADTMALQKYDVQSPDGTGFVQKYWSPVNTPVLNAAGQVEYIIHSVEDVTEKIRLEQESERRNVTSKKAVAALAESEERFRSLAINTPGAFFRAENNAAWHMIYITDAIEDITGWSAKDFLDRKLGWAELVLPEDMPALTASMQAQLAKGRDLRAEYRIRHADGTIRWVQSGARLLKLPDGMEVFEGFFLDATERKRAEQALEQSEARFRVMADASPSMTWIGDAQGGLEFINRRGLEYLGCPSEQLLGDGWLQYVHPDDLPRLNQIHSESPASGKSVEQEYRMRRHDGQYRWQLSRAVPELDALGKPVRWFGVITDIEDIRSAREAAEEAARIKSTFLSSMSHEIRTPMNAIVGMTSILLDTPLTPDQQDAASIIRSSGEHLLTVINDILDYSKVEAGKMELESTPFSLRDCVESALDLVSGNATAKGVEVGYLMQAGTPEGLLGDVGRLRQVLVNLLSNAVKFTPGRGQVMVEIAPIALSLERCEVEIAVRDNGIGISPEAQGKLFQPFMQADASTTRTHGGTGLGLSISKRIVELMGGSISVESELGSGSTFRFSLKAAQAALGQRMSPLNAVPGLHNRRVLIVDDLEINRRILHHYTLLWGMVPLQTESPKQALDWIERGDPFDLVLLDYHMPEMDGLQLAREIRQRRDERSLPIVMLSSVSLEPAMAGVLSKTMLKPIKPSKLLDVVSQVMMDSGHTDKAEPVAFTIPRTLGRDNPLRILVAEDNAMNQKVARLLLEKLSYQADFVGNGEEAIAAVARQIYDLVLMDVQMPVMDGLDATREICRRWPAEQRPRIVGMSANAMHEDRQIATLAGMDDYVPKPVTIEELVRALRNTLRRAEGGSAQGDDFRAEGYAKLRQTFEDEGAREVIAALVDDLTTQSSGLTRALQSGDMRTIKRVAHTFKATCQMLGAESLARRCLELEERAEKCTPDQVRGEVQSMLGRYTTLVQRFKQEDAAR